MGRNLEAHRQRYLTDGDFPSFWLGFDAAVKEDALATKETGLRFVTLGLTFSQEMELWDKARAWREASLTPEELLAALEPPQPVVERKEPLTLYEAWDNFVRIYAGWWDGLVMGMIRHPYLTTCVLGVFLMLVLMLGVLR